MQSKERHRQYNLQYYHKKRNKLIQQLGGKCVMCGSTENLEFDHIESINKQFGVSSRIQNNNDNIQNELNKCQLLCHRCHIIKSKEHKDINAKINKDIAIQICNDYFFTNATQYDLSVKYGVSQRTISSIIRGDRWKNETATIRKALSTKQHKE